VSGRGCFALALAVALALSGCAAPSWMPFAAKAKPKAPDPPPPPPPRNEPRAPILSRNALPADGDGVVDRVICVVNSDAITLYELEESEAFAVYESKLPPPTGEERTALRDKVLTASSRSAFSSSRPSARRSRSTKPR